MKPEKYNIERDEDDRCTACKSEDTDCECVGYNQACDDWEKHLPSEEKMQIFTRSWIAGVPGNSLENELFTMSWGNMRYLITAIHKRIHGEGE